MALKDKRARQSAGVVPSPVSQGVSGTDSVEQSAQDKAARLDALARSLASLRSEAIQARAQSGIEQDWMEDEEYYQGIDDNNRHEHSAAWQTRPAGALPHKKKGATQSTLFINITKPYVNAATGKVSDILMPSDKGMFSMLPMPIPDLIDISVGNLPKPMLDQIGAKFPGNPKAAADHAEQLVRQAIDQATEAKSKADKAQEQIETWQIKCQFHAQMRLVIKDAGRIGSGVIKGPVPSRVRNIAFKDGAIIIEDETVPVSMRVSAWNCYPDGACGQNIHNGSYFWEKDDVTEKQLRKLKGGDYLDDQIDVVIKEGPQQAIGTVAPGKSNFAPKKGPFEIWYCYKDLDHLDMAATGFDVQEGKTFPALITMVNNHVIKAALNPLDTGDFPYDVIPWGQARPGMPWGTGIGRDGRTPQRVVNGATRAMMDNAGRAAGPQVIKGTQVTPNDGIDEIAPWKSWDYAEDGDIDDVRKAFTFVAAPMYQVELANIVQMGMKWMEDSTGLPMLLQGQSGSAPDLVGVVQILSTNASSFLRDLGRSFDDYITEPHNRRYYVWLLQYGKDEQKGEFILDARGSSTNVERELQNQELMRVLQLCLNPVYGVDPKKAMEEYLTSRRFDSKRFQFDDQKWEQIVANMGKGPQDQRLAVAQLRAQVDTTLQKMEQQFEAQENDKDRRSKEFIAMIDKQIAMTEVGSAERQVLERIKAELAKTAITVNAQESLTRNNQLLDLHKHNVNTAVDLHKDRTKHAAEVAAPVVQLPGRAKDGQAFSQQEQ